MRAAGIIAEYNPFHSGHAYQIAQTRRLLGPECAVVCCMSGCWVQSGAAAAPDKGRKKKKLREILGGVIFIAVLVAWLWLKLSAPSTGYYCYGDDYY